MGQNSSKGSSQFSSESSKNLIRNFHKSKPLDINPPKITISRSPNTEKFVIPASRHYPNVVHGNISLYKLTNASRRPKGGRNESTEILNCFVTSHHPNEGHVNGYTFTSTHLRQGDGFVVKIISDNDPSVSGHDGGRLGIGFTSCDPKSLSLQDLPQRDPQALVDRPEYWVLDARAVQKSKHGDEILVKYELSGEIRLGQNGGPLKTLVHVDTSVPLWSFLVLSGSIIGVRLLGRISAPNRNLGPDSSTQHGTTLTMSKARVPAKPTRQSSQDLSRVEGTGQRSVVLDPPLVINTSLTTSGSFGTGRLPRTAPVSISMSTTIVSGRGGQNVTTKCSQSQVKKTVNGSTEGSRGHSRVGVRERKVGDNNNRPIVGGQLSRTKIAEASNVTRSNGGSISIRSKVNGSGPTFVRKYSQQNKESAQNLTNQINEGKARGERGVKNPGQQGSKVTCGKSDEKKAEMTEKGEDEGNSFECIICCEQQVETVFLPCGHVCLCFECAGAYWDNQLVNNQICPMCRGKSTGYIRTFTS